jgi:NAD-dependent dihydropyrimidine dehydrogenase PreA subunit
MIEYIKEESCDGCGNCADSCPMDVLRMDRDKNKAVIRYQDDCMSCFVCEEECPNSGTIYVDPKRADWICLPW